MKIKNDRFKELLAEVSDESTGGIVELDLDAELFSGGETDEVIPASDEACSISDALLWCLRDTGKVDIKRIASYV